MPSRSYRDWWHGQWNQKSSTHGFGRQPRCGQICESARTFRAVPSPVGSEPGNQRAAVRIDRHDERPGLRDVRREAVGHGQSGVGRDQVVERADADLGGARRGRAPQEPDRAARELRNPDADPRADRASKELRRERPRSPRGENRATDNGAGQYWAGPGSGRPAMSSCWGSGAEETGARSRRSAILATSSQAGISEPRKGEAAPPEIVGCPLKVTPTTAITMTARHDRRRLDAERPAPERRPAIARTATNADRDEDERP